MIKRAFFPLLLLPLLLSGCAGEQQHVPKERFFWPPLPDRPRIEWLGAYSSQLDFTLTRWRRLKEFLFGADAPITFKRPIDIRSDGAGRVYLTDPALPALVLYDFNQREVSFLPKIGSEAPLLAPLTVALDGAGNVYVADGRLNGVMVLNRNGDYLGQIGTSRHIERISAIAIDARRKRLLVTDTKGQQVGVFSYAGAFLFAFGKPGGGDGEFNFPVAVTVNSQGEIIVADAMNARVQIFDGEGRFLRAFGQRGGGDADFELIKGVAVDSDDNIYVTDGRQHQIKIFSRRGEFLLPLGGKYDVTASGKTGQGGFVLPQGIDIDKNDTIYVVDQLNRRFQVFQYLSASYLKQHPLPGVAEITHRPITQRKVSAGSPLFKRGKTITTFVSDTVPIKYAWISRELPAGDASFNCGNKSNDHR